MTGLGVPEVVQRYFDLQDACAAKRRRVATLVAELRQFAGVRDGSLQMLCDRLSETTDGVKPQAFLDFEVAAADVRECQRELATVCQAHPEVIAWDFVRFELQHSEQLYRHTCNPIFVWTAYHAHRRLGRQIPEWVLDAFDRLAQQLVKSVKRRGDAKALLDALELAKPGGGPGVARRAVAQINRAFLAHEVVRLQDEDRLAETVHGISNADIWTIFDTVAERHRVSAEHVRNCYYHMTELDPTAAPGSAARRMKISTPA